MAVAYAAIWSPAHPTQLASVAGDGQLLICDTNAGEVPSQVIPAHQHEVLTLDWNKYNEYQIVTGSVDKTIRVFDMRNPAGPLQQLFGHQLAVRRLKCHPFNANSVVSASYDMTANIFDLSMGTMTNSYTHHSEFVLGIDLSLFEENLMATAAWDRTACVWNFMKGPPVPCPPGMMQPRPQ
jgi:peroxin-7